jgi:uncharacterized iron-regulated membrane protein
MRQALGYAALLIAAVAVVYGFWILLSASKEYSSVPKNQLSYIFLQNLHRFKGRFAIFFVFIGIEIALFLTIAVTTSK